MGFRSVRRGEPNVVGEARSEALFSKDVRWRGLRASSSRDIRCKAAVGRFVSREHVREMVVERPAARAGRRCGASSGGGTQPPGAQREGGGKELV